MSATPMKHRPIGNTGMLTSVLSFGFWATYGVKDELKDSAGVEHAKELLTIARKAGVNLYDNAEVYGETVGDAETIMGEAIAQLSKEDPELWRRSDILVTTKIFWGGKGLNEKGLSRKHIQEGLTKSLERLQMDYVDMVFCHRPDELTSTATIVRAMTDVVRSGKAMAWGVSEWSAQQITEATWIATQGGLEPPCFEQPQYNMFHRERVEREYYPLYKAPYNLATTIWSPLASGLLTGKYNESVPEGSRLAQKGYEWLVKKLEVWREDGTLDKVEKLSVFAKETYDCSVSQLALAWCVKNPNVTTVLLGATKPEQLRQNLDALPVVDKITEEHMEQIEKILGNKPESWVGIGARTYA